MEWVIISFVAVAGACVGISHHSETIKKEQKMQAQMQALQEKNHQEALALAHAKHKKPAPKSVDVVVKDLA